MSTIRAQIHRNAVAIISLFIALSSLSYNSWRNETTEAQRNIRFASFRVLESLGELQEVADYRFYYLPFDAGDESEGQLRIRGYGAVSLIHDLTSLMPEPAPPAGEALFHLWNKHVDDLVDLNPQGKHSEKAKQAEQQINRAVKDARKAVLVLLKSLE
ncbi:MAG: hypothetical protein ACI9H8_000618 [Lysobacterales bacterium]|jgi:hypothetical protein